MPQLLGADFKCPVQTDIMHNMSSQKIRHSDFFSPFSAYIIFYSAVYFFGVIRWIINGVPKADTALIYSLIGIIAYIIGVCCFRGEDGGDFLYRKVGTSWTKQGVVIITTLYILVGFFALFYMIYKIGVPVFSKLVLQKEAYRQAASSYTFFLIRLIPIGFLFIAAHNWSIRPKKKISLKDIILIITVTMVCLLVGSRNIAFFYLLSLAIIYHYTKNQIQVLKLFFGSIFLGMFFLLIGFYRAVHSAAEVPSIVFIKDLFQVVSPIKMYIFYMLLNLSAYSQNFIRILNLVPHSLPYQYGGILIATLSTVLPGKQYTFEETLKTLLDLDFPGGGMNPTILGELYGDFGVSGILIGMFAYGALLGFVYRRLRKAKNSNSIMVYSVLYSCFIMGTFTGLMSQAMYIFYGTVVSVTLLLINKKRHNCICEQTKPQ